MPCDLSPAQKDFVDSVFGFYIELPTQNEALSQAVADLKDIFAGTALPEQHPYCSLQTAFANPEIYFSRLEDHNPELSFGVLRTYLLESVERKIAKVSPSVAAELWPAQAFKEANCTRADFATAFRSTAVAEAGDTSPWAVCADPNIIYHAELIYRPEELALEVKVTLHFRGTLPNDPIQFQITREDLALNDNEQAHLIASKIPEARQQADALVAELAGTYLVDQGALTPTQYSLSTPEGRSLVLQQFYFDFLNKRPLALPLAESFPLYTEKNRILRIDELGLSNLSNQSLLGLFKAQHFDVYTLVNLTPASQLLLSTPHYRQLFVARTLTLDSLSRLSLPQAQLACLPTVIYLQIKAKLTHVQVFALNPDLRIPLLSTFFVLLFEHDKLSLAQLASLDTQSALILANDYYACEFSEGRLSLGQISPLHSHETKQLLTPAFITLQKKTPLSFSDLKSVPETLAELLPYFVDKDQVIVDPHPHWHLLCQASPLQLDSLRNSCIRSLLLKGKLTLPQILALTRRQLRLIKILNIAKLFSEGKISLHQLNNTPQALATIIDRSPCLYQLIARDIFPLSLCTAILSTRPQLMETVTLAFGGRLIGLCQNQPLKELGTTDSLELLKHDLITLPSLDTPSGSLRKAVAVLVGYLIECFLAAARVEDSLLNAYLREHPAEIVVGDDLITLSNMLALNQGYLRDSQPQPSALRSLSLLAQEPENPVRAEIIRTVNFLIKVKDLVVETCAEQGLTTTHSESSYQTLQRP